MHKAELLEWMQEQYQQLQMLLDDIGLDHMTLPGACGDWTVKDVVAHLSGWQRNLNARMQAAQRGEPAPPPPWPARLEDEDDINAWIHESTRHQSVQETLDELDAVFRRSLDVIRDLPDDAPIRRDWRLVTLGDEHFPAGELFDHFRDDHEAEIRAWLQQL